MNNDHNLSRRDFIKLSGMTGAALSLGFYVPAAAEEAVIISTKSAANLGIELNAWISIDTSGKVTIINHRAEMGQGSYQSVPQIIAEELEVNFEDVQIVFATGNSAKYGSQITGGSSTIRGSYKRLSKLAASAREVLIEAFARRRNVDRATCMAEYGRVFIRPTAGREASMGLSYGELVEEASKLEVPKNVTLKRPDQYKILRQPMHRRDTPLKTNGSAIFGLDKRLPGMKYAVVERNPRFLGKVKSFDDTEARKVTGVTNVFTVKMGVFGTTREGVAVVADNLWAAMQGRKALKVEWDDSGFDHHSTEQLYAMMNEDVKTKEGISYKTKGDVNDTLAKAEIKLEATYETPYESHSCMEPINCIADVKDDSCEIWGPIQGPDWIQDDISTLLKLPKEKVTVNMTFLGGGFGRKAFTDYPQEAVMISKEIKGPVQVVWTREDDTTQGPFRPGMVYQLNGSLTKSGRISAFKFKMAGQNMDHQWPGANLGTYNSSATEGLLEGYLESLPHYSFADIPLKSPVPVMWWRSVYSSTNGFAYESFLDEMAIAAGKDPLDFRRQFLEKERYQILIDKLEQVSQWKERGKDNKGWGVAITECFGSIVGEVVKVYKNPDGPGVKIAKVWAVMDCGWYVNPDIIKAQVEGSIVMALAAATKHATTFKDGKAVETNFNTYAQLRISECPEIEVINIDNDEPAGGVGEPGLPPFTPALTNAIFDLTGKRIRKLPFSLAEV